MKEIKYTILYCVCENFCDFGSGSSSGTVINYGSGSDFLRFRFHNAALHVLT
jgi:hypothetical protein